MADASILSKHFTAWPEGADGVVVRESSCVLCGLLALSQPEILIVSVARRLMASCQSTCASCGMPAGGHRVGHPHAGVHRECRGLVVKSSQDWGGIF